MTWSPIGILLNLQDVPPPPFGSCLYLHELPGHLDRVVLVVMHLSFLFKTFPSVAFFWWQQLKVFLVAARFGNPARSGTLGTVLSDSGKKQDRLMCDRDYKHTKTHMRYTKAMAIKKKAKHLKPSHLDFKCLFNLELLEAQGLTSK